MTLTEQEQLNLAHLKIKAGEFTRSDPLLSSVWLTKQGVVVAVSQMSLEHMCAVIALWMKQDFMTHEYSVFYPDCEYSFKLDPRAPLEELMNEASCIFRTAPLRTMWDRIQMCPEGVETLRAYVQRSSLEVVDSSHDDIEKLFLSEEPVFF